MIGRERSHRLLIVERIAPGDRSSARGGRVEPVLHVVLLGHSGRTRVTHVIAEEIILDIVRRILVYEKEPPPLGGCRTVWMPGAEPARLPAVIGGVWKYRADERKQFGLIPKPSLSLHKAMPEIFLKHRVVEERFNILVRIGLDGAVHAVTGGETDPDVLRLFQFIVAAALLAGGSARSDADQVDRPVT